MNAELKTMDQEPKSTEFKYRRPEINITSTLPRQTIYSLALNGEFSHVAFDEVRVLENKSLWRKKVFKVPEATPVDLEIGTGTGIHFALQAQKNPSRCIIGMELKYKPLIQSIRRALVGGCKNAAITRYHAFNIDKIFAAQELDNVYIHFPDPWTSPKKPKNRVVNRVILQWLYEMQRPGSFLEFKTDSREYFLWALEEIKASPYKVEFETLNLYEKETKYLSENVQTTFEKIFVKQGIDINYIKLIRE